MEEEVPKEPDDPVQVRPVFTFHKLERITGGIFFSLCLSTDQVLIWAGADFGTDIGSCNFIGPIVTTEESVFENYYIEKGSYPGKDQASSFINITIFFEPNETRTNWARNVRVVSD